MTTNWWTDYWYYWLLFVLLSWLAMEIYSVVAAHLKGEKPIVAWTLSDTIRRWSSKYRWLAPVTAGIVIFLLWHFFLEQNPTS